MPLVIISGYPSSGKTYRSKQIATYFQDRAKTQGKTLRVHHLTDTSLSIPRTVYDLSSHGTHERSNNSSEKDARALVSSAVKRLLSLNDVVVLDAAAGNYIKGWRYQLFCEAKGQRTTCCVVHVGTPIEIAREQNEQRLRRREEGKEGVGAGEEEGAYEVETWENLVFRFEEPNGMTRWDSPLFTIGYDDVEPPNEALWAHLIGDASSGAAPVVRPNAATVQKAQSSEGYLYELDRVTQEIVRKIGEWGRDHVGEGGGEVEISEGLVVELPNNTVQTPALQRLRRQFISMQRTNPVLIERIRQNFVAYLNDNFQAA